MKILQRENSIIRLLRINGNLLGKKVRKNILCPGNSKCKGMVCLEKDCAFGFPAGHADVNYPLLMGETAELKVDPESYTLTLAICD